MVKLLCMGTLSDYMGIMSMCRDAHTEFRTLRAPYSSYSVLAKMAVPRAKIRTPGVRYSSYSVLSVPGAENNDRAPYWNSYSYSTVLCVLRTPRASCWKLSPYPVRNSYPLTELLFVLRTLRTLCTFVFCIEKVTVPQDKIRTPYPLVVCATPGQSDR